MRRRHELPFGAELIDQSVRFRLWAPAARNVALALEGQHERLAMSREGDGWFALLADRAHAGSRYRYLVDGELVPDPAARFQPGDVNGASEVVDPLAYDWQDEDWRGRAWEEIVLYELHVGAFSAGGDFAGAARHLDHLVALGVTAIELMPVADFAGRRNWGYDGVLLFAPDASYGRPADLKRLVEACHRRGLAVLLDVVYNHFGPEGNYLGRYAPDFFTARHHTPWGAAINFDGAGAAAVRRFYIENALYWLEEYHLDGLRLDAVHAIHDESPRHILAAIAEAVARLDAGRPIHLVLENDRNEAWPLARAPGCKPLYTAQWNDDLHHALHVVASGETQGYYADYADAPMARLGRALAEGFAYQGEPSAYRDGAPRGEASTHLPPTAFVAFIQNHDQVGNTALGRRLSEVADATLVRLAVAIVLLSPQIPLIFMGEEWGTARPFPFFCDFTGELADKVREGRRREFARFPEFRDPGARERIPDPCAEATFLAAKLDWGAHERPPHDEWLGWYRMLIALRAREIAPRLRGAPGGQATWAVLSEAALVVRWRLGDGAAFTVHANFGRAAVKLGEVPAGRMLFSTSGAGGDTVLPPRSVAFHLIEA